MKNITVSVDDAVYAAARRKAAERNTSISRLVAEFLRSLNREDDLKAERQRRLTAAFTAADARTQPGPAGPVRRDEIYDSRLR